VNYFNRLMVIAVVLLIAGGWSLAVARSGNIMKAEGLQMKIEIASGKKQHLVGEDIFLSLKLINPTDQEISLPNFRLPANKVLYFDVVSNDTQQQDEKLFQSPGLTLEDMNDPSAEQNELRIEAGKDWERQYDITPSIHISEPGNYTVNARLAITGQTIKSDSIRLEVSRIMPTEVHIGRGLRDAPNFQGEMAYLEGKGEARGIYTSELVEERTDLGEFDMAAPRFVATTGADARQVKLINRKTGYQSEMENWVGWLEGDKVFAKSTLQGKPGSINPGFEIDHIIDNPLKSENKPLHLLLQGRDQQTIALTTFSEDKVALSWTFRFNETVKQSQVVEGLDGQYYLLLLAEKNAGIAVFVSRFDQTNKPDPQQLTFIPKSALISNTAYAMEVDNKGKIQLSLGLQQGSQNATSHRLMDLTFTMDTLQSPDIQSSELKLEGTDIQDIGIAYFVKQGEIKRRDVAIQVNNTDMYIKTDQDAIKPALVSGKPFGEITLITGIEHTYILYSEPDRGLFFDLLF